MISLSDSTASLNRSSTSGRSTYERIGFEFGGVLDDAPPVRTPSPLPGLLRDADDVAVEAVAFRDGTVRTWGSNSFGSLGRRDKCSCFQGRHSCLCANA